MSDNEPHQVSQMICDICNREWIAVHAQRTTRLECPGCGFMVQAPTILPPDDDGEDYSQPTS